MRAFCFALIVAAVSCAAPHAHADPPNPSHEAAMEACFAAAPDAAGVRACFGAGAHPCIEEGMGATMALSLCWSNEAGVWARRAQAVQARLQARDPGRVESLRISSAAFEAFVDAECSYRGATFDGGSGAQPAMARCSAELWRERSLMLEETERSY